MRGLFLFVVEGVVVVMVVEVVEVVVGRGKLLLLMDRSSLFVKSVEVCGRI